MSNTNIPTWLVEVIASNQRIAQREGGNPKRRGPKLDRVRNPAVDWDALFDGERHVVTPPNPVWFQRNALDAAKRRELVIHTRRHGPRVAVWAEHKEGAA